MRSKRTLHLCIATALLMASAACIHKTGGAVTPMERLTTDNALFAQINNSVEQGAEAVASSGLLTPQQVAPVIAWTAQVAQAHQQMTAIIGQSAITSKDYATVQALVAQVTQSANVLVSSGVLGVKNPKTRQTIASDINAISNLATAILTQVSQLVPSGGGN